MAIKIEVDQNSPEWFNLRAGRPTTSEFSKIITPSQGKYSASAKGYQRKLVGELILGRCDENQHISWQVELGKILESEAVKQYEFIHDVKTEPGGFWMDDNKRWGSSPDRLIGDDGLQEVKCKFSIEAQMVYVLATESEWKKMEVEHKPQIMGQLWTCEREYAVWWIFHESLPPAYRRIYRDEAYIKKMAECMDRFLDELNDEVERAMTKGWIDDPRKEANNAA